MTPHDIEKQSVSTPRNDKRKGVDRGHGNHQPPPSPSRNTGGNPDPDNDPDKDSDREVDQGRKAGRPARAPPRPSIPRDPSSQTRGILIGIESLAVSIQPTKLFAEPRYFFPGEDKLGIRNWVTACEDYFDQNPTEWENHNHWIVFALGKKKKDI